MITVFLKSKGYVYILHVPTWNMLPKASIFHVLQAECSVDRVSYVHFVIVLDSYLFIFETVPNWLYDIFMLDFEFRRDTNLIL